MHNMVKHYFMSLVLFVITIVVYFPSRHARYYDYIPINDIINELELKVPQSSSGLKNCSYEYVTINEEDVDISFIKKSKRYNKPLLGGEYKPDSCLPLEKSAIIVPYRNRVEHLNIFIHYMHWFLQKQNIHYRLFIVNQNDSLPFNRAKMINYGAKLAIKMGYHCLIIHDVDLIPINTRNIYACTKRPRHMSSCLDTFRYNLPYLTLFGGAVSLTAEQFTKVNGMSNKFYGWGGEDDDFYRRLNRYNIKPCRFSPEISRYIMLSHKKEDASESRFEILEKTNEQENIDGLNSISSHYIIKLEELYTLLLVP